MERLGASIVAAMLPTGVGGSIVPPVFLVQVVARLVVLAIAQVELMRLHIAARTLPRDCAEARTGKAKAVAIASAAAPSLERFTIRLFCNTRCRTYWAGVAFDV